MNHKTLFIILFILILSFISQSSIAMTGACYLDRSPGGCFERESKKGRESYDPITKTYADGYGCSAVGGTEEDGREKCAWSRGDPGAVKRAQERDKVTDEKREQQAQTILAKASKNLILFEKVIGPLWRALPLIEVSQACDVRSPNWAQTLQTAIFLAPSSEARRLHLTSDEQMAGDAYANQQMNDARSKITLFDGKSQNFDDYCTNFLHSPDLRRLDALQREVTGNYH